MYENPGERYILQEQFATALQSTTDIYSEGE